MAGPYFPLVKNNAGGWLARISLRDMSTPGSFKSSPTIAAGDFKVDKDAGGFNNLGTLPSTSPGSSVAVLLTLSQDETNADVIYITCIDQTASKEWEDQAINLHTVTGEWLRPATAGRTLVVDAAGLADANMVKAGPSGSGATQTAGDLMASIGEENAAAADGDPSTTESLIQYVKQIINTLEGTAGIPTFPAAVVPGNAVSLAEAIRQIYTEVANIDGSSIPTPPTAAAIADAVWDELSADHVGAGSVGERVERLDVIASGGSGGLTNARAVLLDNLDATVSSRASQASVDTIDDLIDGEIGQIIANIGDPAVAAADGDPTTTDSLMAYIKQLINVLIGTAGIVAFPAAATPGNAVSLAEVIRQIYDEVAGVNGATPLDAAGIRSAVGLASANLDTQLDALPTAAENADAVWDEAIAGHLNGGSTGNALNAAGESPWDQAVASHLNGGSFGNLLNTISGYIDTEVAAILAAVDTEVAAIKAKTDNLPAAPAATGDIPTANQNADALLDRASAVDGYTTRQILRLIAAALLGKVSGMATNAPVFRSADDSKNRITATTDSNGNRSAVTLDGT